MNDFIAGLIGGSSGLIVGYPFDTIKCLMQTREAHNSILNSAKILITQTKSAGFFRGLTLPFITYGPITSLGFGIYGNTLKLLAEANGNLSTDYINIFLAGSFSGFILSPIKNPFEVVRIQLQTHCKTVLEGPQKCIKEIYLTRGYLGFFKGLDALILRDSCSFGIYFCTFEFFRKRGRELQINNFIVDLVCGGIAGSTSWFTILPIDTIKSRIQSNRQVDSNLMKEFFIIYSSSGIKGFYKGLSAVILRAFLVNSFTLCFYKQSLELLDTYKNDTYLNHL